MNTIDDSGTFMSRRSHYGKNQRQLLLKKVDIDSKQLNHKDKNECKVNNTQSNQHRNKNNINDTNFEKLPMVKLKRFSDLINFFNESRIEEKNKDMGYQYKNHNQKQKQKERMKRQIINKQCYTSYQKRSRSPHQTQRQQNRSQKSQQRYRGIKLRIRPQTKRSQLQRRHRSQLVSKGSIPQQSVKSSQIQDQQETNDRIQEIQSNKRATRTSFLNKKLTNSLRLSSNKYITEDITSQTNPQQNFTETFDLPIQKILQQYNIKNQTELSKFLSQNYNLESVQKSTSHTKNIICTSKTPMTEYDKTYREYKTIDPQPLNATNYQCLPQLHLKKPSVNNFKTTNCWDYYQKSIPNIPFQVQETQQYQPLQQISYKTSYQHAFSQSKPKTKHNDSSFKPNQSTMPHGSPFVGKTQYSKDFKQPTQKLIDKSKNKPIINQLEYNKHKNGDSHNTFTAKGFQMLRTSYNQSFRYRQSPYVQTEQIKESEQQLNNTQQVNKVKMPTAMYESASFQSYQPEQLPPKTKPVSIWKYHLMCQLKAILTLDKQKKQKRQQFY